MTSRLGRIELLDWHISNEALGRVIEKFDNERSDELTLIVELIDNFTGTAKVVYVATNRQRLRFILLEGQSSPLLGTYLLLAIDVRSIGRPNRPMGHYAMMTDDGLDDDEQYAQAVADLMWFAKHDLRSRLGQQRRRS